MGGFRSLCSIYRRDQLRGKCTQLILSNLRPAFLFSDSENKAWNKGKHETED
jgi:hypothetical protein